MISKLPPYGIYTNGAFKRLGLGVDNPVARIDAYEAAQSEIARFTSAPAWDFGFLGFYSGASVRSRIGFSGGAGGIFSNGVANGTFVRADDGPVMLGIGTSLGLIIREVGYGPGTGYVGVGGINDPLSTLEVGGENAPRLGLRPVASATGAEHWQIVALAEDYGPSPTRKTDENGDLQFYAKTSGTGAFNVTKTGDIIGSPVGAGDVAPTTFTLRGRNAGAQATGSNRRGGLLMLRGGDSTDANAFGMQVGVGAPAAGAEVGADTALTIFGDRAGVTVKSERATSTVTDGLVALNLVARGDGTGHVLTQRTSYNGTWTYYDGWLYEDRVVHVANASRAPAGFQFAQAAQATPLVLVNLLSMAISSGSDVVLDIGLIKFRTTSSSPVGVFNDPIGSIATDRVGGHLYFKTGATAANWALIV